MDDMATVAMVSTVVMVLLSKRVQLTGITIFVLEKNLYRPY